MQARSKGGFTLVEVSIVVVVIALVIAAILIGNDLLRSSNVRATISQLQSIQAAIVTFEQKYGAIPGDAPPSMTGPAGLFTFTGANAGTNGYGDGDGFVEVGSQNDGSYNDRGEILVVWRHLSEAQLIEKRYGSNNLIDTATGNLTSTLSTLSGIEQVLPVAKLSDRLFIYYASSGSFADGKNYFTLSSVLTMTSNSGSASSHYPNDLNAVDSKIDDGKPITGLVITNSTSRTWAATPTSGKCTYSGTGYTDKAQLYNLAYGPVAACPTCQINYSN